MDSRSQCLYTQRTLKDRQLYILDSPLAILYTRHTLKTAPSHNYFTLVFKKQTVALMKFTWNSLMKCYIADEKMFYGNHL